MKEDRLRFDGTLGGGLRGPWRRGVAVVVCDNDRSAFARRPVNQHGTRNEEMSSGPGQQRSLKMISTVPDSP